MMADRVDWHSLAETLGTIKRTENGKSESGGSRVAARALIHILGNKFFLDAVDYTLSWSDGSEASRSVLQFLKPKVAADQCMEIFRSAHTDQRAADAVYLLSDLADMDALKWLDEIFASRLPIVRNYGLRIIDQLWMSDLEADEAVKLIEPILADEDPLVAENAKKLIADIQDEPDYT